MTIINKDVVRKIVVDTALPVETVEKVLDYQFEQAVKQMRYNKSVEISGFGTFRLMEGKAKRKLKKYEKDVEMLKKKLESDAHERYKVRYRERLASFEKYIIDLKKLLNSEN